MGFLDDLQQYLGTTSADQPAPTTPAQPEETGGFLADLQGSLGTTDPAQAAFSMPQPEPQQSVDQQQGFFSKALGVAIKPVVTALDLISRPLYASARFTDVLERDGIGDIAKAVTEAGREFWDPKLRLSYSDVIKRNQPSVAADYPKLTSVLGLIGDIALDPSNWLTLGYGDAVKITTEEGAKLALQKGPWTKLIEETAASHAGGLIGPLRADDIRKAATRGVQDMIAAGDESLLAKGALRFGVGEHQYTLLPYERMANAMGLDAITKAATETRAWGKVIATMDKVKAQPWVQTLVKDIAIPEPIRAMRDKTLNMLDAIRTRVPIEVLDFLKNHSPEERSNISEYMRLTDDATRKQTEALTALRQPLNDEYQQVNSTMKDLERQLQGHQMQQKMLNDRLQLIPGTTQSANPAYYQGSAARTALEDQLAAVTSRMAPLEMTKNMQEQRLGELTQQMNALQLDPIAIRDQVAKGLKVPLTPKEQDGAAFLWRKYMEMGRAENEAGLATHLLENYAYRKWDQKTGQQVLASRKGPFSKFLGPAEHRVFATSEEAIAKGYTPETDAALLYALRLSQSQRAIEAAKFEQGLFSHFGVTNIKELDPAIQKAIRPIGNSAYGIAGADEGMQQMLKGYDSFLNAFKRSATVIKPSFSVRHLISRPIQSYLAYGWRAMRSFDPRNLADALAFSLHGTGAFHEEGTLGKKLASLFIDTDTGLRYTANDIRGMAERQGILRDLGEAVTEGKSTLESNYARLEANMANEVPGYKKFIGTLANYTTFPSHIENASRMSLFLNALKQGHGEEEAGRLVNKAFFDYAHGLSVFNKNVTKRIIPFATFNRFASGLLATAMLTTPNRIANLGKISRSFFDVWNKIESGNQLTEGDRNVLPGYLIEQPNVYAKQDSQGKSIFRTFNNFSLLDIMGTMDQGESGEVDWHRTLQKMALSQIAPFIKYPIELMSNMNFFTGQKVSEGGRIGKISPEQFAGNLAAAFSQAYLGVKAPLTPIAALAGTSTVPNYIHDFFASGHQGDITKAVAKKLIGWEESVDGRTGKANVWINPYALHVLQTIMPSLNQLTRTGRPENSPTEKMLDFFGGVGTVKLDLARERRSRYFEQNNRIQDAKKQIMQAFLQGRTTKVEDAQKDLRDVLSQIAADRAKMDSGE